MKKRKTEARLQWHPAFYADLQIELGADHKNLVWEKRTSTGHETSGN